MGTERDIMGRGIDNRNNPTFNWVYWVIVTGGGGITPAFMYGTEFPLLARAPGC